MTGGVPDRARRRSAKRGPVLLAAAVAMAMLLLSYRLVVEAPHAPGDHLLLALDARLELRHDPPGRGFGWLVTNLGLWEKNDTFLRTSAAALLLLGIVALAGWLPGSRGCSLVSASMMLVPFGLWPWLGEDPTEFVHAAFMALPLVLAGSLWLARGKLFFLAALGGALSAALVGMHVPAGEAGFLFVLLLARRGAWPAVLATLAYGAGFAAFAAGLPEARPGSLPSPNGWWMDAGATATLPTEVAVQGMLLLIAGAWFCLNLSRATLATRLAPVLGLTAVAVALALAGTGIQALMQRSRILARDARTLDRALQSTNLVYAEVLFLNLPMHVRPYLASVIDLPQAERLWLLDSWDTGRELHLPEEWGGYWEGTTVIRWTARGFEKTTWGACLALEPFPLVRRILEGGARFPASPYGMIRLGVLPQALGGAAPASEVPGARIEDEPEGDGVRLRVETPAPVMVAVALGGGRRRRVSDPGFLERSLSDGWFRSPPPVDPAALGKARVVGHVTGYGPVLSISSGTSEFVVRPR